jgi:hypothetical protein
VQDHWARLGVAHSHECYAPGAGSYRQQKVVPKQMLQQLQAILRVFGGSKTICTHHSAPNCMFARLQEPLYCPPSRIEGLSIESQGLSIEIQGLLFEIDESSLVSANPG